MVPDILLETVDVGTLESHPWQVNIPDLSGSEWDEFVADIRKRGVQDPIRVSCRKGYPVVVDGHQRRRAALELDIERLPCIIQDFSDEAAEVEYLVGAARHRRHLTDAQKVRIAMKYKEQFAPEAAANVGGRPKAGEAKPPQNFGEVSSGRKDRETDTRAAAAVGISREKFRQGQTIIEEAPEPVREAWEQGEAATHVAYELTRKASDPLRQALKQRTVGVDDAIAIQKTPELREAVSSGEKTPTEAASAAQLMRESLARRDAETGEAAFHKMTRLLTSIRDVTQADWDAVHDSLYNRSLDSRFRDNWLIAAHHMLRLAEGRDVYTIDAERTVDA